MTIQSILSSLRGSSRSLIVATAVAGAAFSAFVMTGETSVQAGQSREAAADTLKLDAATAEARIAAAFTGARFAPTVEPACPAKRVRVVYPGYGEPSRQQCAQAARL